jgi:alanine dehydrogenase
VKVGIPRELKDNEYRVAITPAGVHELVRSGQSVVIEKDAGIGSSITDDEFVAAGAEILPNADDVWATADLVLKVKEPIKEEYHRMRRDQVLFTYLHLAASPDCTQAILDSGISAVAYETVQLPDGSLPLLAPMSEVAGRMAPQAGAHFLERAYGGRGVLMGGAPGVYPAKVVVLGAGISGSNAAWIAQGMEAEVYLLDKNVAKLREVDRIHKGRIQTVASNAYEVERAVLDADLVIGAVLVPGAKAPMLGDRRHDPVDEEGRGAGGHLRRPGRLLRDDAPDDALRPGLRGARRHPLLRGQHARRRTAHVHLRADQRHHAVRRRAGHQRPARRVPGRPGPRARRQRDRRAADLPAGG